MPYSLPLFVLLYLFAGPLLYGQTIDGSFRPETLSPQRPEAITILSDGKLLVAGRYSHVKARKVRGGVARFTAEGVLDTDFELDDRFLRANLHTITEQTGGRLLLAGSFTYVDGSSLVGVIGLLADGQLDPAFTTINEPDLLYGGMSVLPNGKIMLHSRVPKDDAPHRIRLYLADGTPSPSFPDVQIPRTEEERNYIAVIGHQDDNSLILAGYKLALGGVQQNVLRLDTLGRVDTTFNPVVESMNLTFPLYRMAIRQDGAIAFQSGDGMSITVVDRDGATEWTAELQLTSYGPLHFLPGGELMATYVDKYTVFDTQGNVLTAAFQVDGIGNVGSLATGNGQTVGIGAFSRAADDYSYGLARFELDFSRLSFSVLPPRFYGLGWIETVLPQSDGGVIAAGSFERANGRELVSMARFDALGKLDDGFTSPAQTLQKRIYDAVQLNDGRIVVASSGSLLQLLDSDGTALNVSFPFTNPFGIQPRYIDKLAVDGQDRVYAGEPSSRWNGEYDEHPTYRYQFDAQNTIDETYYGNRFAVSSWLSYHDMLVDEMDRLLLFGVGLKESDTSAQQAMIRLQPDGGFDETFRPELPDSAEVLAASLLPSGNLVVGVRNPGSGYPSNGPVRYHLYQLRPDGSRVTFGGEVADSGRFVSIESIIPTPNDEILVAGRFATYRGQTVARAMLLDTLGNYLRPLITDSQGFIRGVVPSAGGDTLYAAGNFYLDWGEQSILRFTTQTTATRDYGSVRTATLYPNPNTGQPVHVGLPGLSAGTDRVDYRLYTLGSGQLLRSGQGKPNGEGVRLDLTAGLPTGSYLIVVSTDNQRWAGRLLRSR